jgi:hypothetical protein
MRTVGKGSLGSISDSTLTPHLRVLADRAWPSGVLQRLKFDLTKTMPCVHLRAIVIFVGERAVTLDTYHDGPLDVVIDWLQANGWDLNLAISDAVRSPLVRVEVARL